MWQSRWLALARPAMWPPGSSRAAFTHVLPVHGLSRPHLRASHLSFIDGLVLNDLVGELAGNARGRPIVLEPPKRRRPPRRPTVFGSDTKPLLFPAPATLDEIRPLSPRIVLRYTRQRKRWTRSSPATTTSNPVAVYHRLSRFRRPRRTSRWIWSRIQERRESCCWGVVPGWRLETTRNLAANALRHWPVTNGIGREGA